MTYTIPRRSAGLDFRPRLTSIAHYATFTLALAMIVTASGCAHDRPGPAAAASQTGLIFALTGGGEPGSANVVGLAQVGPDGVGPVSNPPCQADGQLVVHGQADEPATARTIIADDGTCRANFESSDTRDRIALRGLSPAPLEAVDAGLIEGGVAELAAVAAVARESGGALDPAQFVVSTRVEAFELYATRWAVVTLHHRPRADCETPACAFQNRCASPSHSAVVIYSWNKFARFRGESSLRERLVHVELADGPDDFVGLLEVLGMIAVDGADTPWLVASRRRCDGRDFLLAGPTGAGWGVLAEAG